jgi:NDP-sugar pyrophosphorylase family protein
MKETGPEPLLPVGDRSLLERVFDAARDVVDEFVVVTGYRGEAIRDGVVDYFKRQAPRDSRFYAENVASSGS